MITSLTNFFHMGGYGLYVWGSYASVISFLFLQWFLPWRRWKKYLNETNHRS